MIRFLVALSVIGFGHVNAQEKETTGVSRAVAYDCKVGPDDTKVCSFDAKNVDLNNGSDIVITFADDGSQIACQNGRSYVPFGSNETMILIEDNSDARWYGGCNGEGRELNMMKATDEFGTSELVGSLTIGSDSCEIGTNLEGVSQLSCKPASSYPDNDEPLEGRRLRARSSEFEEVVDYEDSIAASTEVSSGHHGDARDLGGKLGDTLDIMVFWTHTAECEAAGLAKGCIVDSSTTTKIKNKIQLSVNAANVAFTLSGVKTQLRLLHSYRDLAFFEKATYLDTLKAATNWATAKANRKALGADLVNVFVGSNDSKACGIGWIGPNFDKMFSLTNAKCPVAQYSFAHEVAHNIGGNHDRGSAGKCADIFGANYGYRTSYDVTDNKGKKFSVSYRTIMAYDCNSKDIECDNVRKVTCPRIQRFSDGSKGGFGPFAKNDNAGTINANRFTVAGYF